MEGVTVYGHDPECYVTFGKGDFNMFDEILISTIELLDGRIKTFLTHPCPRSLHESLAALKKNVYKRSKPGHTVWAVR